MIRPIKRVQVIQLEAGPASGDNRALIGPPAWRLNGLDFIGRSLLGKIGEAQERIAGNRIKKAQGKCALGETCSLKFMPNHDGKLDGKRELIFTCPRKAKGCADRIHQVAQEVEQDIGHATKRIGFWVDQQK